MQVVKLQWPSCLQKTLRCTRTAPWLRMLASHIPEMQPNAYLKTAAAVRRPLSTGDSLCCAISSGTCGSSQARKIVAQLSQSGLTGLPVACDLLASLARLLPLLHRFSAEGVPSQAQIAS